MIEIKQKIHWKVIKETLWWFIGAMFSGILGIVLCIELLNIDSSKFNLLQTWPLSTVIIILFLWILSKWKSFLVSTIICGIITSIGVVIAYELPSKQVVYTEVWLETLQVCATAVVAFLCIVISLSSFATFTRKTFYIIAKRPVIKIDNEGVFYKDGIFRVVLWDEIEKFHFFSHSEIGVRIQLHIKKFPTVVKRLPLRKNLFWRDILRLSNFDFIYEIALYPTNYQINSDNIQKTLATHLTQTQSEMTMGLHHPDSEKLNEEQKQFAQTINVETRTHVWSSIADLFLDTDVSLYYNSIAKELASSSYTIKELNHIYKREVAPICYVNLFSVAGVWAGIDNEWLEVVIVKRLYRYKKHWWLRILHLFSDRLCTFMTKKDWKIIIAKVKELRKNYKMEHKE
ncbi:hypothetical protein [Candidatus Uabimicrobium sp. HlEnr_7]|uniref:DUF7079 family protein n=1 Tax=Candidatus Uabimicrobium helgolandensis TaxID=3095367 RepID=UPI0035581CBE